MTIIINIKTDNAAFEDNVDEVSDILHKLSERVKVNRESLDLLCGDLKIYDSNGNAVGYMKMFT